MALSKVFFYARSRALGAAHLRRASGSEGESGGNQAQRSEGIRPEQAWIGLPSQDRGRVRPAAAAGSARWRRWHRPTRETRKTRKPVECDTRKTRKPVDWETRKTRKPVSESPPPETPKPLQQLAAGARAVAREPGPAAAVPGPASSPAPRRRDASVPARCAWQRRLWRPSCTGPAPSQAPRRRDASASASSAGAAFGRGACGGKPAEPPPPPAAAAAGG